jgi:hypothetical protein
VKVNWKRSLACARYAILLGSDEAITLLAQMYFCGFGGVDDDIDEGNRLLLCSRDPTAYMIQLPSKTMPLTSHYHTNGHHTNTAAEFVVGGFRNRYNMNDGAAIQNAAELVYLGRGSFVWDENIALRLYNHAHDLYVCHVMQCLCPPL